MRKHLYAIPILAILIMQIIWPRLAAASEIDWQINWQYSGMLQEEIHISGQNIITADSNWNISQEGERYVLRREVENWESYEQMKDRLPLQVHIKNYLVFKKIDFLIDSETTAGLFQIIDATDQINLNITAPGFLIGCSGEKVNEASARWMINRGELLQQPQMMTVITTNGLLIGICILVTGLLIVAIIFTRHLRKANRIIEEEYALTKINSNSKEGG